jgi:AraC family transcriptional regulator, transcriptional activator of pobA
VLNPLLMKKGLINFKGLYGDNNSVLLSNFIHHESLETRSKMYDWEINEHLHTDLYQLFIIKSGDGILVSENREINLQSPCIISIPTNTLHGFHFQSDICGDVITLSESFLESILKNSPKLFMEINQLQHLSFKENVAFFKEINVFEEMIRKELLEESVEKQIVVQSLFQLLFTHIYRFSLSLNELITSSDNRTLRYFQAFQKSIKQSFQDAKSIEEYAKELNITAVHLNRICQKLVQKSALQIVQDYVINEAKKYLLNTSYSISEVSYFLNFKDPAYFTRLFKKQTGISPSDFRKN